MFQLATRIQGRTMASSCKRLGQLCDPYGFRNLAIPHAGLMKLGVSYSSTKFALPNLPVPALNATLKKYLKSVKPYLNSQELQNTINVIKEFEVGDGQKLQAMLENRAKSMYNWLENWWLHSAYLDYRMPVVVYSNPGMVLPFRNFKNKSDQIQYAARVILAALDYKQHTDNDLIPQDKIGKDPLDMVQYKKVMGTCRIPGTKRDKLSHNISNHIVVFHNNYIFMLNVIGEDGILLNEEQLIEQLENAVSNSQHSCDKAIGIFTSEHRDTWGKYYNMLISDEKNKENLKVIEESIFTVHLDKPAGIEKLNHSEKQTVAGAQTIHGGGSKHNSGNRWFDKTIQFIIGEDGINGLTYEHSPAEGQPVAILVDHVVNYIDQAKYNGKSPSKMPKSIKRLDFNISNEVEKGILIANENIDKLVSNLDLNCFTFNMYGKEFIKSQKLSPDSFIQMAIQFAFYRLHKVPGAHYESASTRKYVGGRTETIRSCSEESVLFAECMLNNKINPQDKVKALHNAISSHKTYANEAMNGYGVDRHLLGLKLTAIENGLPVPKFYSDAAFVKSSHMRISTSQVAAKCDAFMCYGPLVDDGYATCYNPRPYDINFATSAFNVCSDTSSVKYRKALEDSLIDMHNVLMKSQQSKL